MGVVKLVAVIICESLVCEKDVVFLSVTSLKCYLLMGTMQMSVTVEVNRVLIGRSVVWEKDSECGRTESNVIIHI